MVTIIIHIPTLLEPHTELFKKYSDSGIKLLLISNEVAKVLSPTLNRLNNGALPTRMMVKILHALSDPCVFGIRDITVINSSFDMDLLKLIPTIIMTDEPISVAFVDRYLDGNEVYLDRTLSKFDKEKMVRYKKVQTPDLVAV